MREINFCCLECGEGIESIEPFPSEVSCSQCKKTAPLSWVESAPLTTCAICQGKEFYLQKDFNRNIGLFLVVSGAILSFILFLADTEPWQFFLPLLLLPLLDGILYLICPLIVICYSCEGIYREFDYPKELEGFDLATSSRLKIRRKTP